MIPNGRMDRLSTNQNGKQLLHFRTSCGKWSDFSDCRVNLSPFTLQKIFGTALIKVARVPKNVARISCLHVLYSAVPTTAIKIKFWYGKIKSWYKLWAQFSGQQTRNPRSTHAEHFIQTWRRNNILSTCS